MPRSCRWTPPVRSHWRRGLLPLIVQMRLLLDVATSTHPPLSTVLPSPQTTTTSLPDPYPPLLYAHPQKNGPYTFAHLPPPHVDSWPPSLGCFLLCMLALSLKQIFTTGSPGRCDGLLELPQCQATQAGPQTWATSPLLPAFRDASTVPFMQPLLAPWIAARGTMQDNLFPIRVFHLINGPLPSVSALGTYPYSHLQHKKDRS